MTHSNQQNGVTLVLATNIDQSKNDALMTQSVMFGDKAPVFADGMEERNKIISNLAKIGYTFFKVDHSELLEELSDKRSQDQQKVEEIVENKESLRKREKQITEEIAKLKTQHDKSTDIKSKLDIETLNNVAKYKETYETAKEKLIEIQGNLCDNKDKKAKKNLTKALKAAEDKASFALSDLEEQRENYKNNFGSSFDNDFKKLSDAELKIRKSEEDILTLSAELKKIHSKINRNNKKGVDEKLEQKKQQVVQELKAKNLDLPENFLALQEVVKNHAKQEIKKAKVDEIAAEKGLKVLLVDGVDELSLVTSQLKSTGAKFAVNVIADHGIEQVSKALKGHKNVKLFYGQELNNCVEGVTKIAKQKASTLLENAEPITDLSVVPENVRRLVNNINYYADKEHQVKFMKSAKVDCFLAIRPVRVQNGNFFSTALNSTSLAANATNFKGDMKAMFLTSENVKKLTEIYDNEINTYKNMFVSSAGRGLAA